MQPRCPALDRTYPPRGPAAGNLRGMRQVTDSAPRPWTPQPAEAREWDPTPAMPSPLAPWRARRLALGPGRAPGGSVPSRSTSREARHPAPTSNRLLGGCSYATARSASDARAGFRAPLRRNQRVQSDARAESAGCAGPSGLAPAPAIRLLQTHGALPLGKIDAPKTARVARSTCGEMVFVGSRPPDPENPALTIQAVNLPRRRMNRWATR